MLFLTLFENFRLWSCTSCDHMIGGGVCFENKMLMWLSLTLTAVEYMLLNIYQWEMTFCFFLTIKTKPVDYNFNRKWNSYFLWLFLVCPALFAPHPSLIGLNANTGQPSCRAIIGPIGTEHGSSKTNVNKPLNFINFIILIYQLMRLKNSDGWNRVTKYGAVSGRHGTNDVWFDIDYAGGDCNGCCPTCCH